MASVYSDQLYIGHAVNDAYFVVSAGEVAVIRTICIFAPGPVAGGTAQLVDHASDATVWWTKLSPDAAGIFVIEPDCRIILPTESRLDILCDAGLGAGCDVALYGYVLTLP